MRFWYYGICAKTSFKPPSSNIQQGKTSKFSLSLHLHPYFVYVCSDGFGESAHLRSLVLAFVARKFDKYRHLICWFICFLEPFAKFDEKSPFITE